MSSTFSRRGGALILALCLMWGAGGAELAEEVSQTQTESTTAVEEGTEENTESAKESEEPETTEPTEPSEEEDGEKDQPSDPPQQGDDEGQPANPPLQGDDEGQPANPSEQKGGEEKPTDPPEQKDGEEKPTDPPQPEETEDPTTDPPQPEDPTTDPPAQDVFEISEGILIKYHGEDTAKRIEIPEGVQIIGREAFRGMEKLEILILPDSVEEIQELAFADCARLKEIVRTSDSGLNTIGAKAFLRCVRLSRDAAEGVENVAEDAFEGVPEETPGPEKTEGPDTEPAPTDTPAPESTPTPAPTEDPYEEIEWEDMDFEMEISSGGAGSRGGKRQTHGRARTEARHDYDQVNLDLGEAESSQAMHTLTLDGEELELRLDGPAGAEREFTLRLLPGGAGVAPAQEETLLLQPADAASGQESMEWRINGAALRKLSKSGIEYLAFQQGEQYIAIPTEGFLAGWAYDELKSRGTAGRRFDYTLTTDPAGGEPRWSVTVEGQTWTPGMDQMAPMYLEGVVTGTREDLEEEK